jgi:hypothetical protein
MQRYANRSGDSGVVAFEIDQTSIKVQFRDGWIYVYTFASTGAANVEEMKRLALAGQGLNSFISRVVRKNFASKHR